MLFLRHTKGKKETVMNYTLPEAHTLTQEAQEQYSKKQEAITKFFQEHILPIKEEGYYAFSYKDSEISKTFIGDEFVTILKEHGYTVGYGGEGKLLNMIARVQLSGRGDAANFFDDPNIKMLIDDAMAGRMVISWDLKE